MLKKKLKELFELCEYPNEFEAHSNTMYNKINWADINEVERMSEIVNVLEHRMYLLRKYIDKKKNEE